MILSVVSVIVIGPAAQQPQRVKEMGDSWQVWARRTFVLPRPGEKGE